MSLVNNMYQFNYNLKGDITCDYCGKNNRIDYGEYVVSDSREERKMGIRTIYYFDTSGFCCSECGKEISKKGHFSEYPENTLEYSPEKSL